MDLFLIVGSFLLGMWLLAYLLFIVVAKAYYNFTQQVYPFGTMGKKLLIFFIVPFLYPPTWLWIFLVIWTW